MRVHLTTIAIPVMAATAAHAGVMLNPVADVTTLERPGSPYVSNDETHEIVNFAWHGNAYLKFDLSLVSDLSQVTGMRLELYEVPSGYSADMRTDIIDLYFSNDHSWSESSDFADIPAHTGQLIDRLVQNTEQYGWASWNMNGYDLVNNAVDEMLTLVLENTQQTSQWNNTSFRSNDFPDVTLRPRLILEGDVYILPSPGAMMVVAAPLLLAGRRRTR